MRSIEKFMQSFGFVEEPLLIIIVCALFLLVNFAGGIFSNIILAFSDITFKLRRTQRPSFRLALVSEMLLIFFIAYCYSVLYSGIQTAQIIFWGFMVLASPLLAAVGGQLTYVALAKRIDYMKNQALRQEGQQTEEDNDGEEGGKEAQTSDEKTNEQKPKEESEAA